MPDAPQGDKKRVAEPLRLSKQERVAAAIVGGLAVLLFVGVLMAPPKLTKFAPQCANKDCVAAVNEVPEGVLLTLVALAGLMAFLAVNGLKLTKFEAGSLKAESSPVEKAERDLGALDPSVVLQPGPDASSDTETGAPQHRMRELDPIGPALGTFSYGGRQLEVLEPHVVPIRVLTDLANDTPVTATAEIEYAARVKGKGNHPWLFKTVGSDDLWKVSYGGQGEDTPTVSKLSLSDD